MAISVAAKFSQRLPREKAIQEFSRPENWDVLALAKPEKVGISGDETIDCARVSCSQKVVVVRILLDHCGRRKGHDQHRELLEGISNVDELVVR